MVTSNSVSPRMHESEEFDRVMADIASIAELIREAGPEGEAAGRPSPEVVDKLEEIGVFRSALPVAVGGFEFSPRQLLELMETLAWHESSTAWNVLGANTAGSASGAFLSDEAVQEYFCSGSVARLSGQGTRQGHGRRVDGGYVVSGYWQYNSGSPIATHIHTGVLGDDGEPLVATLPIDQVTLIANWDVLGLRATGSSDYRIDDVFVPDTHVYNPVAPKQLRGGALYRVGLPNVATLHHAGWGLGVAKRLLEELRNVAQRRGLRDAQFYAAFAELEARYRGMRAFAFEVWGDVERTLDGGGELSTEQISLIHLVSITTNRGAQVIADGVATWAGSSTLRPGVIQRYFRDVYTGVQHLLCSPPVQQRVGKQLSGLAEPDAYWIFYDLIESEA